MKKVYISFLLHGNMCYDRYTKQLIRDKFPLIYATGIRAMHRFPQVTAHIDLPGLTVLSLKHCAPWLLDELRPLVARRQVLMVGCQYAANHALCADEESDLLASKLGMEIMRAELQEDVCTFFPQEMAFHPQSPLIMREIGASRMVVSSADEPPRHVRGVDGSEVIAYPLDSHVGEGKSLEQLYDSHKDGDFVMIGGDFEMLCNVAECVATIEELASRGKFIEWTTAERYEAEVGVHESAVATSPYGHAPEDKPDSPSFSRWVSDPEDIAWHGEAVRALDALRTAGMAAAAARLYALGAVDVPADQARTTEPGNAWDHYFEHVGEYPEVEPQYLAGSGRPTLLSRAWHQALIGINSDSSGWVPWTPRTRHRTLALRTAHALATEVTERFAERLAQELLPVPGADACLLALNAAPARAAELAVDTDRPMAFVDGEGTPIPTTTVLLDGRWSARARVALPAYGYKLLGLAPSDAVETWHWQAGDAASFAGRSARLANGVLTVVEGEQAVEVSLLPFAMSDPAGVADQTVVQPDWTGAQTRVRSTGMGSDLEVFGEVAWAVWLRLVVALRQDRVELTAEIYLDEPRTIGRCRFDPEGLILQVRGKPGDAYYDIPYATIRHCGASPAFVAVQRFAAISAEKGAGPSFGLISLGGNQSYRLAPDEGAVGAGLGASKQVRPGVPPECVIAPDGTAKHLVTSAPDPLHGEYTHRLALVFGCPADVALAAYKLRTGVPVMWVRPAGGHWPAERSLFEIEPDTARPTAFRVGREGVEIPVNDLSGCDGSVSVQGKKAELGAYGLTTFQL